MWVVKFGGSAITVKSEPFKARLDVIARLPIEVEPILPKAVLVHGAGSFGHQLAAEHRIHEGLESSEQLVAASVLKRRMQDLTNLVHDSFLKHGVPVFPIYPSNLAVFENGRPRTRNLEPLRGFFEIGLVPLIPPDGAFDTARGFSIVSGDLSAAIVAKEFSAEGLVFGVDVDGLVLEGRLVERLEPEEAADIAVRIDSTDVSGGMRGKLLVASEVASAGIPVYIVNLLKPGRLRKLLSGEDVPYTRIGRFL